MTDIATIEAVHMEGGHHKPKRADLADFLTVFAARGYGLFRGGRRMQVHVAKADITLMPVDAIVNPANSLGIMGGGAAAAIKKRGGDKIQQEAMACAPIAVGAAVVTTAGRLYAKAVIHAPTMEEPGLRIGVENVRRATRAALIAASRHNFEVIAIPGIGTGIGGVGHEEAARAMVDELRAHRGPKPATIYLVDQDDGLLLAFEEALRNALTAQ
jgi:O-acetyl-ADP-ribose deacetylase (regulator of RNase III)